VPFSSFPRGDDALSRLRPFGVAGGEAPTRRHQVRASHLYPSFVNFSGFGNFTFRVREFAITLTCSPDPENEQSNSIIEAWGVAH
jgi:hypothetical protein